MPSLFRRNNGIFYVAVVQNGRRKWRSLRTDDELEAKTEFQVIQEEYVRKKRGGLSVYFREFLEQAPLNYSPNTIKLFRGAFKVFVRIVGNSPISRVHARDIERFKSERSGEVSPVTVNIELRTLRSAFSHARRVGYIESNPFRGVKPVRVPYKEARHLSEEDFTKLILVVDEGEFRDLIRFAALTMMRRGEIVNLRWVDVDLERSEIHIRPHGDFEPKSGRSRTVPMNTWVWDCLATRRRRGEFVFSDRSGFPLKPGTITHKFKRYAREAKLDEGIHFHSLRHTGISWLINRGVSQAFVQHIAGHSSQAVTQGYTHFETSSLISAVNTLPSMN